MIFIPEHKYIKKAQDEIPNGTNYEWGKRNARLVCVIWDETASK